MYLAQADKVEKEMGNVQKWATVIHKYLNLQELDRESLDELWTN